VIYDGVDYKPYSSFYKPQPEDKAKGARLIIKKIGTDSTWKALPIVVERGGMEYEVADKVPELRFKVKYNQQQFENRQFEFKEGETQKIGRYDVTFIGFDKNFDKEKLGIDSEIAIGASMRIENKEKGVDKTLTPIFYILNNQQFNVPDEDQSLGMKIRFLQPNPTTGNILVQIEDSEKIFVDIAENAMHDYVVMQAIVFPGINLFWLGSLMMLFGLGMGFWDKYKQSFK
jgi:cytochrome c-type biogenesis protein CcmF